MEQRGVTSKDLGCFGSCWSACSQPCSRASAGRIFGAAEARAAVGGSPSSQASTPLPPPSPSTGCRAGEELVKISDLYPKDTNAMQISFAVAWAGFCSWVDGFRAPQAVGGQGGEGRAVM